MAMWPTLTSWATSCSQASQQSFNASLSSAATIRSRPADIASAPRPDVIQSAKAFLDRTPANTSALTVLPFFATLLRFPSGGECGFWGIAIRQQNLQGGDLLTLVWHPVISSL